MLRVSNLKLHIPHEQKDLTRAISKKLRIPVTRLLTFRIVKKSIDARDKAQIFYVYTADVSISEEEAFFKRNRDPNITRAEDISYAYPVQGNKLLSSRPVIIGAGPSGLFAAYFLAKEGYRPILIERGDPVEERVKKVQEFWESGTLDCSSNIQFGEGGAGTFSDGKLYTGVRDPHGRNRKILQTFVDHGAPEEILYQNKPHLGTDKLLEIMARMREKIREFGGDYHFRTCFQEFLLEDGVLAGIHTDRLGDIPCEQSILAIGNASRDTFSYLIDQKDLTVISKPFAVGVRVEHWQSDINEAQYGSAYKDLLPPADYKLTWKSPRGSSVYSFCMCPGGYVVNASSEEGHLCVNGMSYSGRNSKNANSAIVVSVKPLEDPLENIAFQRDIERKAYIAGNGAIVTQRLEDFRANRISASYGCITPEHKGKTTFGNIRDILPASICQDIAEAMEYFGHKIKGFNNPDVLLSAVESRTSSPIRISRDEHMEASLRGVFPIGEGAGYAGGITSAAMDGLKVFEEFYSRWRPV